MPARSSSRPRCDQHARGQQERARPGCRVPLPVTRPASGSTRGEQRARRRPTTAGADQRGGLAQRDAAGDRDRLHRLGARVVAHRRAHPARHDELHQRQRRERHRHEVAQGRHRVVGDAQQHVQVIPKMTIGTARSTGPVRRMPRRLRHRSVASTGATAATSSAGSSATSSATGRPPSRASGSDVQPRHQHEGPLGGARVRQGQLRVVADAVRPRRSRRRRACAGPTGPRGCARRPARRPARAAASRGGVASPADEHRVEVVAAAAPAPTAGSRTPARPPAATAAAGVDRALQQGGPVARLDPIE